MSAPRYEVRCGWGVEAYETAERAQEEADWLDSAPDPECAGPHTVWRIDPDGTETDITDESETSQ